MNSNTSTFLKKNGVTVVILLATLILAGIAVFTAIRLYQLRQEPVALNQPASTPAAHGNNQEAKQCKLSFTIQLASSSPTASASTSPTATATVSVSSSPTANPITTPTATPTEPPTGGNPTPTPTTTVNPTATPAVQTTSSPTPIGLPNAGVTLPTLLGIVAGILLLSSAVLIAL